MEKWLFPEKDNGDDNFEAITLKIKVRNGCIDKNEYPQQGMNEECRLTISILKLHFLRFVNRA